MPSLSLEDLEVVDETNATSPQPGLPTAPLPIDHPNASEYSQPLAVQFDHILSAWDEVFAEIIEYKVKAGRSQSIKDAISEELIRNVDTSIFQLRLWAGDISRKGLEQDISTADALEILDRSKSGFTKMLRAVCDRLEVCAREIQQAYSNSSLESEISKNLLRFVSLVEDLNRLKPRTIETLTELLEIKDGAQVVKSGITVLTFDGGGVKTYSSLLILRALMREINSILNLEEKSLGPKALRPRDIFDFIVGSSSGGLVAIMLGRLRMTVDDCLARFRTYSDLIFSHPSVRWRLVKLPPKYSDKYLNKAVSAVVGDFDPSEAGYRWKRNLFAFEGDRCKTAVIAYAQSGSTGHPFMFRSYDIPTAKVDAGQEPITRLTRSVATEPSVSSELPPASRRPGPAASALPWTSVAQIWEVARATSAAPALFSSITIGDVNFWDGGFGTNNPSLMALTEATQTSDGNDNTKICLVSIGSGTADERQYRQYKNPVNDVLKLARGILNNLTGTESTEHQTREVMRTIGQPYYRFGVLWPRIVKLDEWKVRRVGGKREFETLAMIERVTNDYLQRQEVLANLKKCALTLVGQRRSQL